MLTVYFMFLSFVLFVTPLKLFLKFKHYDDLEQKLNLCRSRSAIKIRTVAYISGVE